MPVYLETCQMLFSTYEASLPVIQTKAAALNPKKAEESDAAWERRVRTETIDVCRFLLPSASLANVGMTINARTLEHALRKMLSHPLVEVRNAGLEMKKICQAEAPTLIKYADAVPYLEEIGPALKREGKRLSEPNKPAADWCSLMDCDPQIENQAMAAALYRYGSASFEHYLAYVKGLSATERQHLLQVILGKLGSHDEPLREMEYASYTFDLVLDQGGYFELKRHRIMTQSPQALTTHLGYAIPRLIFEGGLLETYCAAMEKAGEAFEKIASFNPEVASYVVPNAYNRRLLMQLNLRTADHLLALRSAPNAHFSMRRVAQRMGEEIQRATPLLGSSLRLCPDETWQGIENKYFYKV
jgi:thymidylate synthase ThyX